MSLQFSSPFSNLLLIHDRKPQVIYKREREKKVVRADKEVPICKYHAYCWHGSTLIWATDFRILLGCLNCSSNHLLFYIISVVRQVIHRRSTWSRSSNLTIYININVRQSFNMGDKARNNCLSIIYSTAESVSAETKSRIKFIKQWEKRTTSM